MAHHSNCPEGCPCERDVKYTRAWTFESPTDIELERRDCQDRLKGRWTFLDADSADPESLDDGPRPGDSAQGVKR